MKVTGVPYEEIARRGGGIAASARAFAEADDDAILAQARRAARRDARRRHDDLRGQERLRAVGRRRGRVRSAWAASSAPTA